MTGLADVLASAAVDDTSANEVVAFYKSAAAIIEAPASVRLEAACGWGYHAADPADAAAGLELAVELLTLAAAPGLGYDATRRQLSRWPELPVDAAATQLRIGKPGRAVELLEHGRTVMWSRRTAIWDTPLDRISAGDPSLREQLATIRSELVANVLSTSGRRDPGRQNVVAERRASLTREWNRIMHDVGLGRPAPFTELKAAADEGPVVLLNASRIGSDALVLCDGLPLGHLSLPGDVYTKARAVIKAGVEMTQAEDAVASLPDPSKASDAQLPAVIAAEDDLKNAKIAYSFLMRRMLTKWLWSDVTEPALHWLAERGGLVGEGASMPRLWWCPTGSPYLHADPCRRFPELVSRLGHGPGGFFLYTRPGAIDPRTCTHTRRKPGGTRSSPLTASCLMHAKRPTGWPAAFPLRMYSLLRTRVRSHLCVR